MRIERLPHVQAFVARTGARIFLSDRPFYRRSDDTVLMPPDDFFFNNYVLGQESRNPQQKYYTSLFHELGHWSHHHSRLGFPSGRSEDDPQYIMNEMVVERVSGLLLYHFGIQVVTKTPDTSRYISIHQERLLKLVGKKQAKVLYWDAGGVMDRVALTERYLLQFAKAPPDPPAPKPPADRYPAGIPLSIPDFSHLPA